MKPMSFFILLVLLTSCSLKPRLTGKVWSLVDVSTPRIGKTNEGLPMTPPLEDMGSFFRFYDNGSFTAKIQTLFRYGKWNLDKNKLTLVAEDGTTFRYKVVSFWRSDLVLFITSGVDHPMDVNLHYEAGPVIDDTAQDAFSLQNNLWEIPARQKEPDALILARVRNHLKCQLLYIQKAIDKKEEYLSVTEFTSPLAFYGNGMALKPLSRVPAEWTNLFYDSADASRAYEALKNGFSADMKLPSTNNAFFVYKSILEQLYVKVYLDTTSILITPASRR
ncbi:lipocalin-like domain-containing protein [Dinghuibacter silviterrae]|nr:lipocalin family protein [Dinghuibacter silviterrae]